MTISRTSSGPILECDRFIRPAVARRLLERRNRPSNRRAGRVLDDDDRTLPDRLRLQSAAMDDETVVITHTQYRVIGPDGRILRDGDAAETSYLDFLRGASHVMSGTAMFRKRSFQEVGGYNSVLQFGEGQDLIFRIAREGRICFVPEVLYEYRQHDSNVWFGSSSGSEETASILATALLCCPGSR